jgi:hypothetical protein
MNTPSLDYGVFYAALCEGNCLCVEEMLAGSLHTCSQVLQAGCRPAGVHILLEYCLRHVPMLVLAELCSRPAAATG